MFKSLVTTVAMLLLVVLGAFLQYRFDILGLGLHIQYGQYNIIPGLPALPPPAKQEGTYDPHKFFGKADFKDEVIVNIKGKPYKCVGWYNSSVMLCQPLEKLA